VSLTLILLVSLQQYYYDSLFTGSQSLTYTHKHTTTTVHNTVHTLTFRRLRSEVLNRRSRDRPLSPVGDGAAHTPTVGFLPLMCIGIQKHVRNDYKEVLFLYVTVNVEPYGNVQIMLLCNELL